VVQALSHAPRNGLIELATLLAGRPIPARWNRARVAR
jgi:hypothetical protein